MPVYSGNRGPRTYYVVFPLTSADGSQREAEAAWSEETPDGHISFVGTVTFPELKTPEHGVFFDRHSMRDAMQSARERAGHFRV